MAGLRRKLLVIGTVLLAAACEGSPSTQSPQPPQGTPAAGVSPPVQLGAPPSGVGTVSADAGEIQPADPAKFHKEPGYSPYAGRRYPERPYFGDEHVHTSWSVDAGGVGATLGPEEATRFARGEEVTATSGQPVRLGQPLDWIAVTDHSDMMGAISEIKAGNPDMLADPTIKRWHDMFVGGPVEATKAVMELIGAQANRKLPPIIIDPKFAKSIWETNTTIAEKYNEPGRFTAFIAYEWTSNAGGGDNLHRNIIYRDNKDKADKVLPYTTFQSENPEDLWQWMSEWEKTVGGKILAIPHNGNLSNGRMFAMTTFSGDPMTKAWADARQRWEPLFEAIQMKGQSESHPSLSTTDDFAAYELWDRGNLTQVPKKPGQIQYEYVREALKNGLKVEQDLGTNPFKFGMAGGTDTHNALSAAEEDSFFGKFPSAEPRADRWNENAMNFGPNRIVKGWEMTAAGYTGVWATGNTRAELWDAMMRRETYATSGPRMIVRFFGGYDFTPADATRAPAVAGYEKGVPMGGDLGAAPPGKSPTFLVAALKDKFGGNLDRIQIIKGWLGKDGKPQEKIYDVVWGDTERRKIVNGKLIPVGNTVDVASASWTNTIGDPELVTMWKDPDFDPAVRAVYYARVLEIPTPRWTAYDAAYFKTTITDPKVPMTTQERAFTSPIWYSPK